MNCFFLHLFFYLFLVQGFFMLGVNGWGLIWKGLFMSVSGLFGLETKMVLNGFVVSLYFSWMCFFNFYGFLPWGISFGRFFDFVLCWALVGWLMTYMLCFSQELMTNVFGLHGESLLAVFYAMWGKMLSVFVRPLSLSLRLFINLMVGHFFLFFSVYGLESGCFFGGLKLYSVMLFLVLYEGFVLVLQSFIFSRLMGVYLDEV